MSGDVDDIDEVTDDELKELKREHEKLRNIIPMEKILQERLNNVLIAAEISPGSGSTDENVLENERIIRNEIYVKALSISSKGYTVWIKRDIDEIYINNYNPEWIKSWNGNMDIQPCFDYFAVITYITDYYMKDESGTVGVMKAALENCQDESFKQKMNVVKNAFLTGRQAGESEVYYKLLPQLHLSDSNIGVIFLETGFKKNRSKFLRQIQKEEINNSNKDNIIEVEGKEDKYFIEKTSWLDKWYFRPMEHLKNLSYSHFGKRYDPVKAPPKDYNFEKDMKKAVTEDTPNEELILEPTDVSKEQMKRLPLYIPLVNPDFPDKTMWMKKRSPRCIRFHKYKKTTDRHQYFFSQMQLFLPHEKEDDLYPDDSELCEKLYLENQEYIQAVKHHVMPHFEKVVESRERAEEFISNIGDVLDANKEQEEEECEAEGVREHPSLDILDRTGTLNEEPTISTGDRTFRKIELQNDDDLHKKIRSLDSDQKKVFDIGLKFAQDYMKASKKSENIWPKPPLVAVLGGAGSGKSHVIDVLSQMIDKTFRKPGEDPNCPYVLKLAFTGNAAAIIKGQTLHSAFKFKFGNDLTGLSDKLRDLRRTQLHNLRFLIIDEISLVRSDLLYQLNFRLQKDIFQNNLPFGGLAVFVFGDIMQIRPPGARHVFLSPLNPRLQILHALDPLWRKFEVMILKTNHRQGEDKPYADLLNRVRVGEQTEDDIKMLNTRVFPRNSSMLPKDALIITGTNEIVNKFNNEKLNELPGELFEFKAEVSSNTSGVFVPKLDKGGQVSGTTLQYMLRLKVGCRVMLTWNIDVCDSLVNGSLGEVVGFKRDSKNRVKYVLVKFDDPSSGQERRRQLNLEEEYPGEDATAIEKMELEFTYGEKA